MLIYPDVNARQRDYEQQELNQNLVTKIFHTIQGEGPLAGKPAVFVRLAGCNLGKKEQCPWCLPEYYWINTDRGKVRLRDVRVGDKLVTFDEQHRLVWTTVNRVLSRRIPNSDMVTLWYRKPGSERVKPKRFRVSADHPFEVKGRGFVAASKLRPDDVIYHATEGELHSFNKRHTNPMHKPASVLKMLQAKEYKISNQESRLLAALETGLECGIEFVGNIGLIVGDKARGYIQPDFRLPGTNKLVELYDRTGKDFSGWNGYGSEISYKKRRRAHYKHFGYEVLFLAWQDAWTHPGSGGGHIKSAAPALEQINRFAHNGAVVERVERGVTSVGQTPVVNFSCTPYNTFLFEGLHTHNCDTYFQLATGKVMRVADIFDQAAKSLPPNNPRLMVLTGGEPMLQNPFILVDYFLNNDWAVQIETNGYFWSQEMHEVACRHPGRLTIVVSPKVNVRNTYPMLDDLLWMDSSCLKVLVDDDPKSPYFTPPTYAHKYHREGRPVYVSPITHYLEMPDLRHPASVWHTMSPTIDHTLCARNHRFAAQIAKTYGWRVSLQTHLFLEAE